MNRTENRFPGLTLIVVLAALLTQPARADYTDSIYLGVGAGLSELEPDTGGTAYSVSDSRDTGFKGWVGYRLDRRISLEAYYSDLGEATLSPSGSVGYKDMGISGLYHVYRSGDDTPWSLFARAGIGVMKNQSSVNYDNDNGTHLMFGLGIEYPLSRNIALRGDLDLYDRDSRLLAFGVVMRLGGHARQTEAQVAEPAPRPITEPVAPESKPDTDADGIIDEHDKCPDTAAGEKVDETGCPLKGVIVLKGINFALNSDEIVGDYGPILDEVVSTLKRYPDVKVEVAGHTDSQGPAAHNKSLSQRRAEAVRDYLASKGIAADHLTATGYGEDKPVADNKTAAGRAQNRRVELHLQD